MEGKKEQYHHAFVRKGERPVTYQALDPLVAKSETRSSEDIAPWNYDHSWKYLIGSDDVVGLEGRRE